MKPRQGMTRLEDRERSQTCTKLIIRQRTKKRRELEVEMLIREKDRVGVVENVLIA